MPAASQPAIYFVLQDHGSLGTAWAQRDPNECDRETTIRDLMSMQFDRPLQVIEVILDERTSRDVTADVCQEIADRAAASGIRLHDRLIDLIHDHCTPALARELERMAA